MSQYSSYSTSGASRRGVGTSRRSTTYSSAPKHLGAPSAPTVTQRSNVTGLTNKEKSERKALRKMQRMSGHQFGSETSDRMLMDFSSYSIQNKKIQNTAFLPQTARIQKGLDILEQLGVMPTEEFNISSNELAEKYLFGVNCTLSAEGANFSLLSAQTDQEKIENPNITNELKFMSLKPEYLKVPFCFPEECNPFYNLDDRSSGTDRLTRQTALKVNKPYLLRVAAQNSQMNLRSKPKNRLRYFQDIKELEKRGKF